MTENPENLKGKNWMAAMALCWLFGTFGAHRFYTGKSTTACVMLALTLFGITAPVSAIWAFVDGVLLTVGEFKHDDGSELYERVPWFGWIYVGLYILIAVLILLTILVFVVSALKFGGSSHLPIAP